MHGETDLVSLQPQGLARFIDHTLLKPDATLADIEKLCDEALEYGFFGICINSVFAGFASERLRGTDVKTICVVGFPLGANLSSVKAFETERAIVRGAQEIDMVIGLGAIKEKSFLVAEEDIRAVVAAAGDVPVKVILETSLLNEDEIAGSCKVAENAGARFVKTSTGFLGRGASLRDIEIMRANVSEKMQIKASGGIKSFATAKEFLLAGAHRLGTSSGIALIQEREPTGKY